jgi:hypothetical protein
VDGILEAAKETGANVEEVAKVTVNGAIDAAASIGTSAVQAVKDVLLGTVESVKQVAGAALPQRSPGAEVTAPAGEEPASEEKASTAESRKKK